MILTRWRSGRDKKLEGRRKIARSSVIAAHLSNVSAARQDLQRFETRLLPTLTHVLPPISTFRFAHLCRSRPRGSIHSLLPSSLMPVRLGPFHVAHPIRSIRFSLDLVCKLSGRSK